jgi:hypothetical protein
MTRAFPAYARHIFVPRFQPSGVVVVDNLAAISAAVRAAIAAADAEVRFLPRYSPRLQPDRERLRQAQGAPPPLSSARTYFTAASYDPE